MPTEDFFEEPNEHSNAKIAIVTKYFEAWANVMISAEKKHDRNKIAYIDLFCGPGKYKDGTKSIPLLILERAINHRYLKEMLVTVFNDADPLKTDSLKRAIFELPNINILKHQPQIKTTVVGRDLANYFNAKQLVPTLLFADPWGYKGLSLDLISSVVKDWGSDCIFFFNYNRVNMVLGRDNSDDHIDALFGAERALKLKRQILAMTPQQRENAIIQEIKNALLESVGKCVQVFRFADETAKRTSHYLIFVSKHPLGIKIIRGIMAKISTSASQGVPSFEFNPEESKQFSLGFEKPLEQLKTHLLKEYCNQEMKVIEIFNVDAASSSKERENFTFKNYQEALRQMENEGKIKTDPPAGERLKRQGRVTMGENVKIAFPSRSALKNGI